MTGAIERLIDWLAAAPSWAVVLTLSIAAALENLIPPIPADVVVLFGGVVAGQGAADPWVVFLCVWLSNVATALLVYFLGRRFGAAFFGGRWGSLILRAEQLRQLGAFYNRYGVRVIFVSRFLPMFRAVVPAFAGISGVPFWRTALPMAAASAIWYGLLVYLGTAAGRNWRQVADTLSSTGRWLWVVALVLGGLVGWWWWRSR